MWRKIKSWRPKRSKHVLKSLRQISPTLLCKLIDTHVTTLGDVSYSASSKEGSQNQYHRATDRIGCPFCGTGPVPPTRTLDPWRIVVPRRSTLGTQVRRRNGDQPEYTKPCSVHWRVRSQRSRQFILIEIIKFTVCVENHVALFVRGGYIITDVDKLLPRDVTGGWPQWTYRRSS